MTISLTLGSLLKAILFNNSPTIAKRDYHRPIQTLNSPPTDLLAVAREHMAMLSKHSYVFLLFALITVVSFVYRTFQGAT